MINAEKLTIGAVLIVATAPKTTRTVDDFRPHIEGQPGAFRRWLVNGQWLTLAEIDARYRLPGVKNNNLPKRQKKAADA